MRPKSTQCFTYVLTSSRYNFKVWFRQSDKWKGPRLGSHCLIKEDLVHCTSEFQLNLLRQSTGTAIKTATYKEDELNIWFFPSHLPSPSPLYLLPLLPPPPSLSLSLPLILTLFKNTCIHGLHIDIKYTHTSIKQQSSNQLFNDHTTIVCDNFQIYQLSRVLSTIIPRFLESWR